MASAFFVNSSQQTIADNTIVFLPIKGRLTNNVTSANVEEPIRTAGTAKNLICYASSNAISSGIDSTLGLYINGSISSITVSYPASQSGYKEDTTHTESIIATDELSYKITLTSVAGTNNFVLETIAMQYDTASNCLTLHAARGQASFTTASSTLFNTPDGLINFGAVESANQYTAVHSGTLSNLFVQVSANLRTTDTSYATRLNSGAGAQSVTYTSTQTGVKEDTTHTDSVSAGNTYGYSITSSTGTNAMTQQIVAMNFLNTSTDFNMYSGSSLTVNFNTTGFIGMSGTNVTSATESEKQIYPEFAFTTKLFTVGVSNNTIATSASTFKTRVNTADGAQSVSFGVAETGVKQDTVNTDSIPLGSTGKMCYEVITPNTSGSLILRLIGCDGYIPASGGGQTDWPIFTGNRFWGWRYSG